MVNQDSKRLTLSGGHNPPMKIELGPIGDRRCGTLPVPDAELVASES
jgi:hypothetical protein